MKHKLKHLIKKAKIISLSDQEKDEIKASILKHMESNPLSAGSGGFIIPKKVSYFEWIGGNLNNRRLLMPAVFSLVLIFTTGIGLASAWSLPGSPLYPVKILKEKVNSVLAFDPIDKTNVFSENATNRLEEAEKLFIDGKLDEETETQLVESFESNLNKAEESILALEKKDRESSAEAALKLKGELDRYNKILTGFSIVTDKNHKSNKLSQKVEEAIVKLENKIGTSGSSQKPQEMSEEIKKNNQNRGIIINTNSDVRVNMTASSTIKEDGEDSKPEPEDGDDVGDEDKLPGSGDENEDENDDNAIKIPEVKVEINAGAGGSVTVPSIGL